MNNLSNGFLVAMLLCSFMTSANAADQSKEVDRRLTTVVITALHNDFQNSMVPWGMANHAVSKGATRYSTRNIASLSKVAKRKDAFGLTAFANPGADRTASYQAYFQDGKTVTNPHNASRWQLICW